MKAPIAKKIEKKLSIHGHTRVDPYFWLRERDKPGVIDYLKKENKYTSFQMKDTEGLQECLFEEIKGRIKQDDCSVPYRQRGYYYYTRFEKGREYPFYCRKMGSLDAEEEIMLDVNSLAKDHSYYQIGGLSVSPDTRYLAYSFDNISRRIYTLVIKDLQSGKMLKENIEGTAGNPCWANDSKTLFYSLKEKETLRAFKILRHRLHSSPLNDVEVYHEEDETFSCGIHRTKSQKYLLISCWSILSSEYRFLDADTPSGEFAILEKRKRDHEYSVDHLGKVFYILTNHKAKNFRLMETPVDNYSMKNWKEVIPHRKDVFLRDIELFNDFLVISERREGLTDLRIIEMGSGREHYLDFGEEVHVANISVNPELDSGILRYSYTSLTTPHSIYDYQMESREKDLKKMQEVVGDFSPDNYESKRLHVTARDGTSVPVSLVRRKDMESGPDQPLLLYGYGSYGITMDPDFNSTRLSLLDRGFIFAIAHIRGGQIYGRKWYEDGKLLKKKNTFTDFIDCAEYLIKEGFTGKDHLYAMGGSAGGLLMGAVMNMRPDLFNGMIASVPFVDIVTTMLDEEIPLTTGEYDEWGNPHIKEYYDYMLSYSPYDNVKEEEYPNLFIHTGYHDSQVQYWEPAKWTARLRAMNKGSKLILLHTNMEAGHGGASGRFERLRETAMEYAFLLKLEYGPSGVKQDA